MYIKNSTVKTIYRLIFLIICEAGIVLQYAYAARTGSIAILSCYYTILSNIICFIYFSYLVAVKPRNEIPVLKGALTMCIILTGLGYHLLLTGIMEGGTGTSDPILLAANQIVHTIVPIMVFSDYLFFTPKGSFKSLSPLVWTLIPITYLIFAVIRAQVSPLTFTGYGVAESRYPYPFMDFDLMGTGKVLLYGFVIFVAYIAMGYLFFVLDWLLGRSRRKK